MWLGRTRRSSWTLGTGCRRPNRMRWQTPSSSACSRPRRERDRGSAHAGFKISLDIEVDLLQLSDQLRIGLLPESAIDSLTELLDDPAQRPGIGVFHEVLVVLVQHVVLGKLRIHPVSYHTSSGIETEQIVDGRSQLERALVAVPLHRRDPARIDHPRPEDSRRLLSQ